MDDSLERSKCQGSERTTIVRRLCNKRSKSQQRPGLEQKYLEKRRKAKYDRCF